MTDNTNVYGETYAAVDENRYRNTNNLAVEHGDVLEDGTGNEYVVLIDQSGHVELRRRYDEKRRVTHVDGGDV